MAKKESRRVKTLNGFIKWTAQFNDGQYLFRGVSKDSYKIEASSYRRLPSADRNNPARLLRINQDLIEKARLLGHDQRNGQQLSDLDLLAELQHFGAATCLIDFSRNALIALWFACQQSSTGKAKNGRVFAIRSDDSARFKTITPELITKDIDYFFRGDKHGRYPLYQWQPKYQNNRIISQQSIFIFGGNQIEIEAECIILKNGKEDILTFLDKISGITEATIYPDFDGFARLYAQNKKYIGPNAQDALQRGVEMHKRGDLDDAIKHYGEVISLQPEKFTLVNAYYNRGIAYGENYDFDRSIEDLTKAIELDPHFEAYYNRGVSYERKGDFDRSIEDYTKTIELKSDYAKALSGRGFSYGSKGDFDRSIEDLTKAIELDPHFAISYNNRGMAYRKKGEYDRAIEDYTKAIELKLDSTNAYYNRGEAWLHLQKWEYAKSDLTIARDKGTNIVAAFHDSYASVADFEDKNRIELPADIAEMLTSQQ